MRLVSSARLRPPVLEALVPAEDVAALAEIEGATSQRLIAEARGTEGFGRDEFVHGVPYASFINAAFAYAKPREPNRFNASRGAWYAALAVETCMREVAWHMADFLGKSGAVEGRRRLRRAVRQHGRRVRGPESSRPPIRCLDPDPAIGYPPGNAIADAAFAEGLNGIIYPSVRHAGGTCLAALRPHAVQSVAPGAVYRFEWAGRPEPTITPISE